MKIDKKKMQSCIDLIRKSNTLVLATQSQEGPHTSLMAYSSSHDGLEIYMLTSIKSHKWLNIQNNQRVSLLIDDRDKKLEHERSNIKALTVTGRFIPVPDNEKNNIMRDIAGDHPAIYSIFSGSDCVIIRIKSESFLLLDGPSQSFYSDKL